MKRKKEIKSLSNNHFFPHFNYKNKSIRNKNKNNNYYYYKYYYTSNNNNDKYNAKLFI